MTWKTGWSLSAGSRAIPQNERGLRDRNGTEPVPSNAKNADSEYSALAERKERILRLHLSNAMRRSSLEQLRQSTITVAECVETLDGIKGVAADLLRLPASLCHELANRDAQHIQQVLDAAFLSTLERLSQPETYLDSNP
jgi:hypothetical protein